MTKIPGEDRTIMEKAIYLPMLLIILNRDLTVVKKSPFKLRKPYEELIEDTLKTIQRELAEVKQYMKINNMQVLEMNRDDAFTMYMFLYKGYEEHHNYFNPRIRNKVQELMSIYFLKKQPSRP
jgi:glutathione synthase/RimK-type ligase-like ATP-grasp enzyme